MKKRKDIAEKRRQPAGMEEVLHQILTRGLNVRNARRRSGETVEVIERQRHSETAGDRNQVNDGIGRTARAPSRS